MLKIFFVSVIAGIIQGAPVGVAGALVADAALAHRRKRLELTILAAVSGDTIIAFLTSFAANTIQLYVNKYQHIFFLVAGIGVLCLSIALFISTARHKHGVIHQEEIHGSSKWIVSHTGPALAAFLVTVLHPGTIMAFLAMVALFAGKYPEFPDNKLTFTIGIALGSGLIFSFSAFLFWKIRKKADSYVHYLRYGLAGIVALFGIYLIIKQYIN